VSECIALLRGINVGRARRIAMADLRQLFEGLGHLNVRTLLNSGNVVFQSARPDAAKLGAAIEAAITAKCGFSTAVTVITAKGLARIIAENPLVSMAKDPSRHLVAFVADPKRLAPLRIMLNESWDPDALAFGSSAAYLWCATGILESKLNLTFARKAAASATTRNWATVLKLHAIATPPAGRPLPAASNIATPSSRP
jgi:uncharacterized protein (DUF1697 family)